LQNSFSLEEFIEEIFNIEKYEQKVKSAKLKNELLNNIVENRITITDIDLMSGVQFEEFLCEYFNGQGYQCSTTKASGDQGIDLIAKKGELTIAIQAKCYSGTVGNHAVMEAVAGMKYYSANRCMVITNSTFSKSAIELAKANGVILWDRQVLTEKLNEV
jgi:HJR/Mrr/RecB family endonuclease